MAHVNRYLTALLVVLAATGMEAQTYESALKAALGKGSIESICQQPEFKSMVAELREVIRTVKQEQQKRDQERTHQTLNVAAEPHTDYTFKTEYRQPSFIWHGQFIGSSINIRAPSVSFSYRD